MWMRWMVACSIWFAGIGKDYCIRIPQSKFLILLKICLALLEDSNLVIVSCISYPMTTGWTRTFSGLLLRADLWWRVCPLRYFTCAPRQRSYGTFLSFSNFAESAVKWLPSENRIVFINSFLRTSESVSVGKITAISKTELLVFRMP